jgi:hypothetical protein
LRARLKGKAGISGGALWEGRRGTRRPLRGRWSEEEERKEEDGVRWGRGVSGREREGERAEEAAVRAGPSWAARGEEERWAAGKEARLRGREGKQAGLGSELGLPSYFLPFSFSTIPNLFEFKSKLDSNSYALTLIKYMHQHGCTNMLN